MTDAGWQGATTALLYLILISHRNFPEQRFVKRRTADVLPRSIPLWVFAANERCALTLKFYGLRKAFFRPHIDNRMSRLVCRKNTYLTASVPELVFFTFAFQDVSANIWARAYLIFVVWPHQEAGRALGMWRQIATSPSLLTIKANSRKKHEIVKLIVCDTHASIIASFAAR